MTSIAIVSRVRTALAVVAVGLALSACGYNTIPTLEEQAKAKWADVQNQYQRRTDLIPNLVATVQGYAKQEKEVLTAVVEARAKATSARIDASQLSDPEKIKQFQDAQAQLTGALADCWQSAKIIPSSNPTRISLLCNRSSKVPRTGFPWLGAIISRRCGAITPV